MANAARFLTTLVAVALISLSGCSEESERQERARAPNALEEHLPIGGGHDVIVVSFDALRADVLGTYGYDRETSPNIDDFARKALVFDDARVAGKDTPTSFASMFTGELPYRVFRGWQLQPAPTVAAVFRNAGYTTAGFFHNVQLSADRGFDQGFDHFETPHSIKVSDEIVIEMIDEWLAGRPEGPLFLWVHFITPHAPYKYREFAAHFYDPDYTGSYERRSKASVSPEDITTRADHNRTRNLYDGEVLHADKLFVEFRSVVERHGLWKDSVVVLTSDHGEAFGEHGDYGHGTLYEEVLRVPMIIRHPRAEAPGRTDMPFNNTDLFPTLASLLEVPHPTYMDGVSHVSSPWAQRPLVSVAMTKRTYRVFAVRSGPNKLIAYCDLEGRIGNVELYDLDQDPNESRDLSGQREGPKETLLGHLRDLAGEDPCLTLERASQGKSIDEGLDESRIEELRSLGYIQ